MSYRTTLLGTTLALIAGCSSSDVNTNLEPGGPEPETICTAKQLEAALAEAAPGSIVRAGACEIEGSFVVPADVTLVGEGIGITTIVGPESRPAIELAPGATLSDLAVISKGIAGVIARGDGAGDVRVASVSIQADVGIGFGAERLEYVELVDVTLAGPTRDFTELPPVPNAPPTPDVTGTHGLVLWTVAEARLENVRSNGFVGFGALLMNTATRWTRGGADNNAGVGIMAVDGETALEGVVVSRTYRAQISIPAYGVLFVSKALMTDTPDETADVSARLLGVDVSNNGGIGIMYAGGRSLLIEESAAAGNAFAGLLVAESSSVTVRKTSISGTKELTLSVAGGGPELIGGEGLQLMSAVHDILLEDVTLADNARGGLLVDLGATGLAETTQTWSNVSVTGNMAFGALCQGLYAGQLSVWGPGEPQSAPWDEGIVRDNTTEVGDAAFEIPFDVIGVVDPNFMPAPISVVTDGLQALTTQ